MNSPNDQKTKGHVKKAPNAFFVWCQLFRKKIRKQNPEITICQANVLLGKIWSEMSVEQKKPYFKESERIKKQNRVNYPEFKSKPKPSIQNPKNKKYGAAKKSSKMGDNHHRNVAETRVTFTHHWNAIVFATAVSGHHTCSATGTRTLQGVTSAFSNEHLYESQSKCDPVVMTNCLNNDSENMALLPINSKTEGMSGTLLQVPQQNGDHFDCEYSGLQYSIKNSSRFEHVQTLPLSQPRNKIIEKSQFLVEDNEWTLLQL